MPKKAEKTKSKSKPNIATEAKKPAISGRFRPLLAVFALLALLVAGTVFWLSDGRPEGSVATDPSGLREPSKGEGGKIKILGQENPEANQENSEKDLTSIHQTLALCEECIATENIQSQAITNEKLAEDSVDTENLDAGLTFDRLNLQEHLAVRENKNRRPGHFSLHPGDAYIAGRFEVDKEAYFDSTLYVKDATSISTLNSTTLQTNTANISNILSNSNLHIKGRLPDQDTFHLHDFTDVFIYPSSLTVIGYESLDSFAPDHLDTTGKKQNSLYIKNNLEVGGTIYGNINGTITTDSVDLTTLTAMTGTITTLTATTANATTLDLGTNTISDQNFTGNWSFNSGAITDATWNGAIIADGYINNDITLSNITQITNRSHANLSDIGANTHAQIDTHISSASNPHSVTKAQVGLANVENTALSTWAGSTNITTLGSIGTGTWTATPIADAYLSSISGAKVSGNISGLSSNISGTLAIGSGGTGQTTANDALNALLPDQTGNTNKFLSTDGSNTSWSDIALSQITDPTANLALAMQSYTTTFTFGDDTGAANLFTIADSASNTGTGYLMSIATGDMSLLNPLKVSASDGTFTAIAVNSSGQVGIGTDSQSSQLSIIGGATIGATYASSTLADGWLAVENNLGIGTDSPSAPLEIFSTNNPQLQISYDGSTNATFHLDENGNLNLDITGDTLVLNETMEAQDYQKTCPEGWIWIPGSAKFGTMPGFCVMKWEAKNDSGTATSQPTGNPWVSISQENARAECESLGLGYHLISEAEWMTIAENIAATPINDLDDDAGLQLATAHTDNDPSNALATTADADPTVTTCDLNETIENAANAWDSGNCEIQGDGSYGGDDNDKGYYGTNNQWSSSGYSSGASNKSQLRTHVLSNGNVIWDFAGNVWEWTDALSIAQEHPVDGTPASEWLEYTAITKYNGFQYVRPPDDGWSSSNGIGRLYSDYDDGTATRAFLRGGGWSAASSAGVFTLHLGLSPASTDTGIGFRCAR